MLAARRWCRFSWSVRILLPLAERSFDTYYLVQVNIDTALENTEAQFLDVSIHGSGCIDEGNQFEIVFYV